MDRRNDHLFQPLLYQVATGSLAAGEIAAPLRSVLSRQKNARVLLGTVLDIDPLSKHVLLADGASFGYDWLIVAAGSQSAYYGHEAWREWAPSLKSVEEAIDVRHKILYAFEVAERITEPAQRRALLTFVIVGARPTGVELAGAIAEIARQTLRSEEHTSELQSHLNLVCRLLLEKKKKTLTAQRRSDPTGMVTDPDAGTLFLYCTVDIPAALHSDLVPLLADGTLQTVRIIITTAHTVYTQ